MKSAKSAVLGYDIGGTKIAVCVADAKGNLLASERLPSGGMGEYKTVLPEMVAAGKRVIKAAGLKARDLKACGICAPGPLDIPKGLLLKSPNMMWDKEPVRDDLAEALDIPAYLDNDANAGMLVEWFFGAARGLTDAVYLTMSTGVGGGVITGGRLMQGATGVGAELGHIILDWNGPMCGCGLRGCIEAYCGGRNLTLRLQAALRHRPDHALMRLPEVAGDPEKLGYPALRAGVKAQIPLALEMWDEICLRLAQGVGIMLTVFNPQMVVLGTVAYYSGDMLMDPLRRYLPRFSWSEMRDPCRVEITALGPRIGELAGASVALYGLALEGKCELPGVG